MGTCAPPLDWLNGNSFHRGFFKNKYCP
jgi:hypothetical protein